MNAFIIALLSATGIATQITSESKYVNPHQYSLCSANDTRSVCAKDSSGIPTACTFPYVYKGTKYYGCEKENAYMWCSHDPVYRGGWSKCIDYKDQTGELAKQKDVVVAAFKKYARFQEDV